VNQCIDRLALGTNIHSTIQPFDNKDKCFRPKWVFVSHWNNGRRWPFGIKPVVCGAPFVDISGNSYHKQFVIYRNDWH
jgi:hypothetical protein